MLSAPPMEIKQYLIRQLLWMEVKKFFTNFTRINTFVMNDSKKDDKNTTMKNSDMNHTTHENTNTKMENTKNDKVTAPAATK